MVSLIIDQDLCERLRGVVAPAELRDESGELIGYFTPAVDQPVCASVDPGISAEEIEELKRRVTSHAGRYTTQEVLEQLDRHVLD